MPQFRDLEVGDLIKLNGTWWVVNDYVWSFEILGYRCYSTTSRRTIYEEDFERVEAVKSMHEMEEMPSFVEKINTLIDAELSVEEIKEGLKKLLYGKL